MIMEKNDIYHALYELKRNELIFEPNAFNNIVEVLESKIPKNQS